MVQNHEVRWLTLSITPVSVKTIGAHAQVQGVGK